MRFASLILIALAVGSIIAHPANYPLRPVQVCNGTEPATVLSYHIHLLYW